MNPETPDFKRLFLAVFLMTALLMGYNALFAPSSTLQAPADKPSSDAKIVLKAPQDLSAEAQRAQVEDFSAPIVTAKLSKDKYEATFSSEGASVQDFLLTGYETPIHLTPALWVESRDTGITLSQKTRYQLVSQNSDAVVFQKVTPENIQVTRRYSFSQKPFVLQQDLELTNKSSAPRTISLTLVLQTQESIHSKEDQLAVTFHLNDDHKHIAFSDLEDKAEVFLGNPGYVGFDRRYFFVSLASENTLPTESFKASTVKKTDQNYLQIQLQEKTFILNPGATQTLSFASYLGPKESRLLKEAGHDISENINYGWFGVISRPLLWLLIYINQWVLNFGLAIILLTIAIKLLTFPLTQKSFSAQQQMKQIAPEIKELQKKYGHDKAMLGQKQMEFYREKGINPMAGCLPILLQMPVWFALYQMLGNSVELYEQPFYGWITDLTRPDPYYILPLVMGLSMFASQLIMPPAIDESQPQMKYVMWFMPFFLTFIMLSLPAGLSLYMLVNNLLTIAQQIYIKKASEA